MSEAVRHFMKNPFPEWHSKPLHLTIAEMEDPHLVINELFDHYNLPEFRFIMKEWLDAALKEDEVLEVNYVGVYDLMIKVVEAVWVLKEKNG